MKLHYYPVNLAAELPVRWPLETRQPPLAQLEHFISVAYQASLLYEEGQPVRCRPLLGSVTELPPFVAASGPYILELAKPRPYEEQEIRRLSPALRAPGSLLAVRPDEAAGMLIWGVLRSQRPLRAEEETPWLTLLGRPGLLVDVCGPGNLVFHWGHERVLTLQFGRVEGHGFVGYPVAWSWGRFVEGIEVLRRQFGEAAVTVRFPLGWASAWQRVSALRRTFLPHFQKS